MFTRSNLSRFRYASTSTCALAGVHTAHASSQLRNHFTVDPSLCMHILARDDLGDSLLEPTGDFRWRAVITLSTNRTSSNRIKATSFRRAFFLVRWHRRCPPRWTTNRQ
jgi:hypothetical protein